MAEVIVLLNHTLIDAWACFEVAQWRLFIIQGRDKLNLTISCTFNFTVLTRQIMTLVNQY